MGIITEIYQTLGTREAFRTISVDEDAREIVAHKFFVTAMHLNIASTREDILHCLFEMSGSNYAAITPKLDQLEQLFRQWYGKNNTDKRTLFSLIVNAYWYYNESIGLKKSQIEHNIFAYLESINM